MHFFKILKFYWKEKIWANPLYLNKIYKWWDREKKADWKQGDKSPTLELARSVHQKLLNEFEYTKDKHLYGENEYWATTKETRKNKFRGDCEDFSILLYRRLREEGFPDNDVRIAIIPKHATGIAKIDGDWYLLDNGYVNRNIIKVKDANLKILLSFNLHKVDRVA